MLRQVYKDLDFDAQVQCFEHVGSKIGIKTVVFLQGGYQEGPGRGAGTDFGRILVPFGVDFGVFLAVF